MEATTDITLKEMRGRLCEEKGVAAGIGTLWRASFGARTARSRKTAHAAKQDREDVRARRENWFEGQLDLDPAKLIFIDETGASTKMARLYGKALRGEPAGWRQERATDRPI